MSAGFGTLSDDCVTPPIFQPTRLVHGGCRGNDLRACIFDSCEKLLCRKSKVKADNLGTKFGDEIVHLVVERRACRRRNGGTIITAQLPVIPLQPFPPAHFSTLAG